MINIFSSIILKISKSLPNLSLKLKQAQIPDTPEKFVKKTLLTALYLSSGIVLSLWLILVKFTKISWLLLAFFPVFYFIMVLYMLRIPDVKLMKKKQEIDSEIVFAGRFLVVELESGVPLYGAFKNIAKNYEVIGKYFSDIVTKIDLGTELEDALSEQVALTPSPNFRKILWQIINSQQTGADISSSLKSVVNNVAQEQIIEIKEYGRKLNPLAMFYMIIAVILPSIGITMFIVLSTFLNLKLQLPILLFVSFGLGFMQFMFLAMIKSSRPSVGI